MVSEAIRWRDTDGVRHSQPRPRAAELRSVARLVRLAPASRVALGRSCGPPAIDAFFERARSAKTTRERAKHGQVRSGDAQAGTGSASANASDRSPESGSLQSATASVGSARRSAPNSLGQRSRTRNSLSVRLRVGRRRMWRRQSGTRADGTCLATSRCRTFRAISFELIKTSARLSYADSAKRGEPWNLFGPRPRCPGFPIVD